MKKIFLPLWCLLAFVYATQAQPVLYGVTSNGGTTDDGGVLFSYKPSTNQLTNLVDFTTNGRTPTGRLVQALDGKLYGMTTATSTEGNNNYGVIFSFNPVTGVYTSVHNFNYTDGAAPQGNSLMLASNGKLYGTAPGGVDNSGFGVIFSYDPATATYTKLHDFGTGAGNFGGRPSGALIQATDGKLYGVTQFGSSNAGTIYYFDPATNTFTQVHDFVGGVSGAGPVGGLVQASNGKLYGMTESGGNIDDNNNGITFGVVFSFDPATAAYTKVVDFNGTNGASPQYNSLIQASNGKLYGMTFSGGGGSASGVIFSLNPATNQYTKLKEFDSNQNDGFRPNGSLMQASDGNLYGTAFTSIFSLNPVTSVYTKEKDFDADATKGRFPSQANALVEYIPVVVEKQDQTITFAAINDQAPGVTKVTLSATASSGLPVSFSVVSGPATVSGNTLTITGLGTITVRASQPGNDEYNAAPNVDHTFCAQTTFYEDKDGDTYGNAAIHPGAAEVCNGRDDDCDGKIDEGITQTTYYWDADGDGYGRADSSIKTCMMLQGYVTNDDDCNDTDAAINPGATEVCNDGKDNNCDGTIDEGCNTNTYYKDADSDGYGDPDVSITGDTPPPGYESNNDDCDDSDAAINPGATEICDDGKDNDCDGQIDEGCTGSTTWYRDADGDGWGNPAQTKVSPTQPRGYVSNSLDCNDKNKVKGGPEVCDGIDNDCDGTIDNGLDKKPFYSDFDGDGYGTPKRMVMACAAPPRFVANSEDCNDDNGRVYPGAPELCDGRDNDCDGTIDEGFDKVTFYHDFDKDGYGNDSVTLQACAAPLNYVAIGGDCNDRNGKIHPGAAGPPNDGIDNNCNGLIDEPLQNVTTRKGQELIGEQELQLQLSAAPNPATHYFTLRIQSASIKAVQLRIVDEVGRVVETRQGLAANSTLAVGHNYRPGVYFAEVMQEGKKATLKLLKTAQ